MYEVCLACLRAAVGLFILLVSACTLPLQASPPPPRFGVNLAGGEGGKMPGILFRLVVHCCIAPQFSVGVSKASSTSGNPRPVWLLQRKNTISDAALCISWIIQLIFSSRMK